MVNFRYFVFFEVFGCLLPQPHGISAFYMSCLGQSGADVLPNPAYISLQLSSALSVQALIFS
jgi:hypothetical protein